VGTFVAEARAPYDVLKVRNIADEIRARGHIHTAEVLKLEEIEANQRLVEKLKLRPGSDLYHSLIQHLESGKPISLLNASVRRNTYSRDCYIRIF